ncbi:DMT family transporter [Longirhabdus pacifica]|uniref:DMT family transporter n=1 Tax=Longirhabdus pacifica TaxID=2305227 RepID=UPI001008CF9D|nr:DMT family transporter [Longirhabdus pacifica]
MTIISILLACIAGCLVSLQNIFNSKVKEKAGQLTTTTLVLGLGFTASFIIGLTIEGGDMFALDHMQTWHWFSGILGIGVVTCLVQSISILGPTYATSIILSSQLLFALLFDTFGWLGLNQVPFTFTQFIGVVVIISGALLYKWSELQEANDRKRRENVNSISGVEKKATAPN